MEGNNTFQKLREIIEKILISDPSKIVNQVIIRSDIEESPKYVILRLGDEEWFSEDGEWKYRSFTWKILVFYINLETTISIDLELLQSQQRISSSTEEDRLHSKFSFSEPIYGLQSCIEDKCYEIREIGGKQLIELLEEKK